LPPRGLQRNAEQSDGREAQCHSTEPNVRDGRLGQWNRAECPLVLVGFSQHWMQKRCMSEITRVGRFCWKNHINQSLSLS
jgi:hypothetical protein